MLHRKIFPVFLMVYLFCISQVFASTEDDFQKGVTAFKSEQYTQAIFFFERARRQGMQGSALYFNLASSYFRQGDFKQAEVWFKKASQYKISKYISEYNLGLVALKQNDIDTATKYFKHVAEKAEQTYLVKLATYQLDQLKQPASNRLSAFLQFEIGHDDNITTVTDAVSKEAASYQQFYAMADMKLTGHDKQWLSFGGYLLDIKYNSTKNYDYRVSGAELKQTFRTGNWQNSLLAGHAISKYQGTSFQTMNTYGATTQYASSARSQWRVRYRYQDINNSEQIYAYLAGNKQRLRTEYRYKLSQDKLRLYYEYETNHRSETTTTNGNYSPTRHTLHGNYTYTLTERLNLTGDMSYRISNYDAGFSATPNPARQEQRRKAGLELNYSLNKSWFISAVVSQVNNDSDDSAYRFTKHTQAISINGSF